MKVLAFSDAHGEERVIDGVASLTMRTRFDAVFIVGDVADHGNTGYVDNLAKSLSGVPVYAVPGNMDDEAVRSKLSELTFYVDLKQLKLRNKYSIFGVGGSVRGPFHTPNEYYDDEMWSRLSSVVLPQPSIVLSHSPPFGYFDDVGMDVHIGSRSVRRLMEGNEPFLLFCGHVHEHKGHMKAGGTNIIKLPPAKDGGAAVVEFSYTDASKNSVSVDWVNLF